MKRLILTSMSGYHLLGAGLADLVVHLSYRFAWGQLPSSDELSAYLGARSEEQGPGQHWSDIARPRRAEDKERRNRSLVDFCGAYDTIELWFDPHPNDQLQLIWLLDHFRSHPETAARLVFRLVDFDLLDTREDELRRFEVFDLPVAEAELNTASRSWQAYCSPTPQACFDLLSSNLSALPMLRPALVELLEELPSGVSGLGATEMRLLEMLAWGFANTNPPFSSADCPRYTHLRRMGNRLSARRAGVRAQTGRGGPRRGTAYARPRKFAGPTSSLLAQPSVAYRVRQGHCRPQGRFQPAQPNRPLVGRHAPDQR